MQSIKKLLFLPVLFSFIALLSIPQVLKAQLDHFTLPDDETALRKTARSLYHDKNHKAALAFYLKLDSITTENNPEHKYRIAVCYLNTKINKRKAVEYLEAISENKEEFGEEYYYYIGKAYHLDYRFDKAIKAYNKFLENAGGWGGGDREAEIKRAIDMANNAKKIVADSVNVRIENLGSTVNSAYMDHTPVISTDEAVLMFTSRRPGSTGGLQLNGEKDSLYGDYYEDIYVSININDKWRKPVSIGSNINSSVHDATIGLSPDGQKLYVYRNDSVRWGNIFISKVEGSTWGKLKKLPRPINTDYWEGSASVTSDGNVLYFASNRPEGKGKRDIYRARRLPNGEWGKPENLGSTINTKYADDAPFIHPDGKTLYFSSEGHKSMGGFDIFRTKYEDGEWSEPVNIGYPINSPDDDIYFVLSADGERGYYASAKPGGFGSLDLYVIHMKTDVEAITLVKGIIKGCEGKFPDAEIKLTNKSTGDVEGISHPNTATGKYLLVLKKGNTYNINITAENHKSYSQTIETKANETYKEIENNINLECEEKMAAKDTAKMVVTERGEKEKEEEKIKQLKEKLKIIHFDYDKSSLTAKSKSILDQLSQFLSEHPNIKISITGYTDAKGSDSYNMRLADRRAESAKQYLLNKGIDKNRLSTAAKGEKDPVAPNTTSDGSDNPEGRAKNRRVEFSIMK